MVDGPVFIGGLAHSGKTPLRLMLSGHPNLAFTRRTYMWRRFYERYGDLSRPDNFARCLNAMLAHKHMSVLQPDRERIQREFLQGPATYARLFALFHEHNAERLGKGRWGDQLGMVERYADPIFAAYPGAVMIHMVRDPRTRYAAVLKGGRSSNGGRTGKLGVEMSRWIESIGLAHKNCRRFPGQYKIVRYESLLAHPEETLQELCEYIGEPYVATMVTGEDATRFGDSGETSADFPLGSGWAEAVAESHPGQHVSQPDLAFIQSCARHDMLALDYPPVPIRLTARERLRFYSVDWPANRLAMAARPIVDSR